MSEFQRRKREEGRGVDVEELGAGGEERPLFLPHALLHGAREGAVGPGFDVFSFAISFARCIIFGTGLGGGQREACNEPPPARAADGERTVCISPLSGWVACGEWIKKKESRGTDAPILIKGSSTKQGFRSRIGYWRLALSAAVLALIFLYTLLPPPPSLPPP